MKKTAFFSMVLLAAISFSFTGIPRPQQYKLNTQNSLMVWYCQEDNSMHSGGLMFAEGSFIVENNMLTGGSFELDMNSLVDNDLRAPEENKKLVNRLKSPELFNVTDFPRARFIITKVEKINDHQCVLDLNLTIKGHTRPVSLPVAIAFKGSQLQVVSDDMLVEGVQFGMNTGVATDEATTELKNFKIKISQLFAKN